MNKISPELKQILKKTSSSTKKNKKIIVNLAINYGSKNEILNAFKKTKGKLNVRIHPAKRHGVDPCITKIRTDGNL